MVFSEGSRKGLNGDNSAKRARLTRLPRSCDLCRARKVRCNSNDTPDNVCTNCKIANVQCTHVQATKSLGSSKGYVESLEKRLAKLEEAFRRLLPNVDLDDILADENVEREAVFIPTQNSNSVTRNDDSVVHLSHEINALIWPLNGANAEGFFGKSCGLYLVQAVLAQKSINTGSVMGNLAATSFPQKRQEFWNPPPMPRSPPPFYYFPEDDLMASLIDFYFLHDNQFLPLLHRPTFQQAIDGGLHLLDHLFGGTVLLVCALGARFSDDPRVTSTGTTKGWDWYVQVDVLRTLEENQACLYEIHLHILSVLYLQTVSCVTPIWTRLGIGLRRALDAGAHDAGAHVCRDSPPNARDELWKRAFWVIFFLDVSMATLLGRPLAIRYDDFDVDYPIECDDEYWSDATDPTMNFKQPERKPSSISCFVALLRLLNILTYVKNTIYPMRGGLRLWNGQTQPSQEMILMNFDSVMNKWLESLPPHLTWRPEDPNEYFHQSAFIHIIYHYIRVLIHRPFIPTPSSQQVLTFPSAVVCMSAARSCLSVVQAMKTRGYLYNLNLVAMVEASALVLLLGAWKNIRSKQCAEKSRDLKLVHSVLGMLLEIEGRLRSAGAMCHTLSELTRIPESLVDHVPATAKRTRSHSLSKKNGTSTDIFTEPYMFHGPPGTSLNASALHPLPENTGTVPLESTLYYDSTADFGFLGPELDGISHSASAVPPPPDDGNPFVTAQKLWDAWAKDKYVAATPRHHRSYSHLVSVWTSARYSK
ncbi:hypothetical protein BDZ89DRAFT_989559 [Hymenopellis radicata]|nr:hypothetical protein BDZ89DRAFT_989559 [Hymenopellis radicata]